MIELTEITLRLADHGAETFILAAALDEEKSDILHMLAHGAEGCSAEIAGAAVAGIDTIWGYADPDDTWQSECIDLARHNIVTAIRAAACGHKLTVRTLADEVTPKDPHPCK